MSVFVQAEAQAGMRKGSPLLPLSELWLDSKQIQADQATMRIVVPKQVDPIRGRHLFLYMLSVILLPSILSLWSSNNSTFLASLTPGKKCPRKT